MVVRWLVAILLIGALVAGLFALWPSGSRQGTQLIPTDITVHTSSPRQLVICQQDWEEWGGLSGMADFVGSPPPGFISFMQAADRLAEADNTGQSGRVFELDPILVNYVKACHSLLSLHYNRS